MNFQQLKDEGYQVIRDPVLTAEECKSLVSELWDWLESLDTGIDRKDPSKGQWPMNMHGIVTQPSAAHTKPVWRLRTHAKVVAKFAELWQCQPEDLEVSYDRINIQRPTTRIQPQKPWLHIDQGYNMINTRCYQGLVPLVDMPSQAGTLVVVPQSHKLHEEFFMAFPDEIPKSRGNWVKFNPDQLDWYFSHGLKTHRVSATAGQLVLWDSRTMHQGSYPLPLRKPYWRIVIYVCMKPKAVPRSPSDKWPLERERAKKRRFFEEGLDTSHWPRPEAFVDDRGHLRWQPVKPFPKKPRTYGRDDRLIKEPETVIKIKSKEELAELCGPLALSLAGFE